MIISKKGITLRSLDKSSMILYLMTFVLFSSCFNTVFGDESEATTSIAHAKDSVLAAYKIILEIDRTNGDVSDIITGLNNVLDELADAERAFQSGDYDLATQLSNLVIEESEIIFEKALDLRLETGIKQEMKFRNTMLISFGSVCIIILVGYYGWMQFKRYYLRRLMDSHLEVLNE